MSPTGILNKPSRHCSANGWGAMWRNASTITHYHATVHEALGVGTRRRSGDAARLAIEAGDVAVPPAGTGSMPGEPGFLRVGAYPPTR
jgi:uncharacterized protein YjlB